ncbi:MAG: glycosyltransferase [Alphaproteobacteria bacterium]
MNDRKILHLVIDLSGFGGAEMTLLRYLSAHPDAASQHRVLALRGIKPGASVGATLNAKGIDVQTLGIERITDLPRGFIALLGALRASHATVLSAWLYYPALIATLLRPFLPSKPRLIWHIRSLPYVRFREKPFRWLAQRLLARLSSHTSLTIISNSEAARAAHAALGYDVARWHVIPNAIDPERYHPDETKRASIRRILTIHDDQFVIGAVGRDVPEKGFPDLLAAFAHVFNRLPTNEQNQNVLMIVGRGITAEAPSFKTLLDAHKIPESSVRLLGARDDVPDVMNALDLFVMSSISESFPNVLAEAMATALPCISTDVGDCAAVLSDKQFVVPPRAPEALADAIRKMKARPKEQRAEIGAQNRARIIANYAPDKMINAFDRAFDGS